VIVVVPKPMVTESIAHKHSVVFEVSILEDKHIPKRVIFGVQCIGNRVCQLTDINGSGVDLGETSIDDSVDIINSETSTEVSIGYPADGTCFAGLIFFLTATGGAAG
jgi:hypothetical protein